MSSALDSLKGLARSAVIIFVGIVIGSALGLFAEALIARSMAPAEYGHVAIAYAIVYVTGSLAYLGVAEGVTRQISADSTRDTKRRIFQSGYLIAITGSLIATLLIVVFRGELATVANDDRLPKLLVLFVPYVLVYSLSQVSFAAFRTSKRSGLAALVRDIGPKAIGFSVLGGFVVLGRPLLGALGYWIGGPLSMAVLSLYFVYRGSSVDLTPIGLPDRETIRRLWSFSWPLALGSSVFLVLSNADILMIGYFLHSRFVGYYRSIQPLQNLALLVRSAFAFLFYPVATEYFTEGNVSELGELYVVTTKWILSLTVPIVLVFGLFPADIVRIFFGSAYLPATTALQILLFGMLLRTAVGMDGELIMAVDRSEVELYSAVFGVVANVILNAVLIPRYGIAGAAVATVVGYAIYNLVEVIVVYRTVGTHPFTANNYKPIVVTALVAIATATVLRGVTLGIVSLVVIGMFFSVVQLLSLLLTRSLDAADLFLIEEFEEYAGIDLQRVKSIIDVRTGPLNRSDE